MIKNQGIRSIRRRIRLRSTRVEKYAAGGQRISKIDDNKQTKKQFGQRRKFERKNGGIESERKDSGA